MPDLGVEPLGVPTHDVRDPKAHDDVGDPLVLETLDAVDRERVGRNHMDLEGSRSALFFANLIEPLDQSVEFFRLAAAVHPAVAAGCPLEGRLGVTADEDRDRFCWR